MLSVQTTRLVSFDHATRSTEDQMEIALLVAVLAVVVALLQGGSLYRLAATSFRAPLLLFGGLGLQIVFGLWSPSWMTDQWGLGVLIGSNLLVLTWLVVNRSLPGLLVAAVGLLMNLTVITVNGAMPVSADAVRAAGGEELEISDSALKHEELDDDTRLGFLGDIIPLPGLGIWSIGDVVLAAGLALLAYRQTRWGDLPDAASG
jgi:Family of unknown function (DUF5317)